MRDSVTEQEEGEPKEELGENHKEIPALLLLKEGSIRAHDAVRAGEGDEIGGEDTIKVQNNSNSIDAQESLR